MEKGSHSVFRGNKKTMLKILIHDLNYVDGISRVIPLIKIRGWQKKGALITIFCTKEGQVFYQHHLKKVNYIILNHKHQPTNSYSLIWEIIKTNFLALFQIPDLKNKFNVVYSQSSVIDFLIIPWFLKLFDQKIKWFVMVDNTVPSPTKRPGSRIKNFIPYLSFQLGNILLYKADGIFVITKLVKDFYKKKGYKKIIQTAGQYGIETEIFKGKIPSKTQQIDLLYCGRIHLAKGILDLVEVAKLVCDRRKNFKIGILGEGEKDVKKQFYQKIKDYGLENNFIHFGYIVGKKKGDIYRRSKLFISLSHDEASGHSILEAVVCNKPIITYNLPAFKHLYAKEIKNNQIKQFKIGEYSKIAQFILKDDYKKLKFKNVIDDYTWTKIINNEFEAMREK